MKNKSKLKRETPIQDGDTRPDQNLEGNKPGPVPSPSDRSKITKERGADVNTLEDFKDAKTS